MTYCIGNIIGPHAFLARESPTYPNGCKVILACSATQVALSGLFRLLLVHHNKERDAAAALAGVAVNAVEEIRADLTDFEVRSTVCAST
jgi:hypothetical protein